MNILSTIVLSVPFVILVIAIIGVIREAVHLRSKTLALEVWWLIIIVSLWVLMIYEVWT